VKARLGIALDQLAARESLLTASEIVGQPKLWVATRDQVRRERKRIDAWLAPRLADPGLRIALCGAGSSAYVGETLAPWLAEKLNRPVAAIASTDLVARPAAYLRRTAPTLMLSFSRSGESPESWASIALAKRMARGCAHLVLTCNPGGRMASIAEADEDAFRLLLPREAHDRGFAMTGSFSSMLVASALLFGADGAQFNAAVGAGRWVLERHAKSARAVVRSGFSRLVALGAGCLQATAREACLKVLELTNGAVMTACDTALGFRHGPKCAVNDQTCVVMLVSADAHAARYELDLLRELQSDDEAGQIIVLHGESAPGQSGEPREHPLTPTVHAELEAHGRTKVFGVVNLRETNPQNALDDFWRGFPYLLFCQMLAFFAAFARGVPADNPCPSGAVNRVVQGVAIHPYRA